MYNTSHAWARQRAACIHSRRDPSAPRERDSRLLIQDGLADRRTTVSRLQTRLATTVDRQSRLTAAAATESDTIATSPSIAGDSCQTTITFTFSPMTKVSLL